MTKAKTIGAVRERERGELYSSKIENSLDLQLTNNNNAKLNKAEMPLLIE